jgi:hypothetical protein
MAVNMKNVSYGMLHFTGINYLCHLGVRVPLKWRQWVSLKCGLFATRLYCITSLKPIFFMELMCVCTCVRACGELLYEEKTMPLLHEAVVGAHMSL